MILFSLVQATKKRKLNRLVLAETVDGGLLRYAAERKGDENILVHIRDRDCVAIEVRYHRNCHLNYCRPFTREEPKTTANDEVYKESYENFCCNIVKPRLLQKKEIIRMKLLNQMFLKKVAEVEGIDASHFRAFRLKERLKRDYPQLVFHQPKIRNQSEFVYVEELSAGDVAEEQTQIWDNSNIDDDSDDEEMDYEVPCSSQAVALNEFYVVGLALRNCIKGVADLNTPWPPTSVDLTEQSAFRMVPVPLFNFMSWILGFSDEPDLSCFVKLSDSHSRKTLSICQDIIYIASEGRCQTPKSLALSMATRQLTRSSKLAKILNGFGHCTSHGATLTHETDLAKLSVSLFVDVLSIPSSHLTKKTD